MARLCHFIGLFVFIICVYLHPKMHLEDLMKRFVTFIGLLLVWVVSCPQPLSVSVSASPNGICSGTGCEYEGPTIMINEVMLKPVEGDGSIAGSAYFGQEMSGEWIELYNPHKCESVDISCYFLGNNAQDGDFFFFENYGGGFVLPQGTVVPPQGFCVVRGENAPAVPSNLLVANGGNVVEVVVNSRYCFGGGSRLWFPNNGGWFAFYDANGVPQDAIYWGSSSNYCSTCAPCVPVVNDCGFNGALASFSNIPSNRKSFIGEAPTGMTKRRLPDGGTWSTTNASPTYGTCNAACVDPPVITCNGYAVASASGGTPPYSYHWNDAQSQTTDTAFSLCAGSYAVTVTDAAGASSVAYVTVADFEPTVTHASVNACLSDSVVVLQGYPAGGTYEGAAVTGNVLQLSSNIPEYQLSYTYVDDNGCSSTVPFLVSVSHNIYEMDTAVCSSDLPFQWRGQSITTSGTYQSIQSLETTCDSLYILHFSVIQQPQLLVSDDFIVEQGESVTLQASGAVTYLWSPAGSLSSSSVANPTATPTQSTQYVVRGFNTENCFSVDSVKVLIKQHVDTTICDDDLPLVWYGCTFADTVSQTVVIPDENALATVLQLHLHLVPTTYSTIQDTIPENDLPALMNDMAFMDNVDTVFVVPNSAGCDSVISYSLYVCRNQTVSVDSTVCESNLPLAWNGQSLSSSGQYQSVLQTSCGSDSVVILSLSVIDTAIRIVPLTEDFCENMSAELMVVTGFEDYVWNTGEHSPNITVTAPGVYSVTSLVDECRMTAHFLVEGCDLQLVLPNAITPSKGDGLNDGFGIPETLQPFLYDFEIRIFNRWGEQVFHSTDKSFRWNGEVKGKLFVGTTYNYIIRYKNFSGKPYVLKGGVTVL